MVQLFEY